MKKNTVVLNVPPHARIAPLLSLAVAAILLLGPSAAEARPIGKDGKIHACYRVKGKPKGAMRVVRSHRARCRRGERKMSWSVAASTGAAGSTGLHGTQGQNGTSISTGSNEEILKEQVVDLTKRIETLEGILLGVTNQDLTGMMSTLQGLDNEDLVGAVDAVPVLTSACNALVGQSNELGEGLGDLVGVLTGVPLIGDIFDGVGIPSPLNPLTTCPEA
jgi:hypothetical protein